MASSSADAHSQPKRPPAPMARQSSTSSQLSQSLSDSHQRPAQHKSQRQHVVGQSRVQRSASGKNLTKLNKLNLAHGGDGTASKHHRRNPSGNSISAPSSPRPGFKRNASTGGAVRVSHQPHAHAPIRKNHSSGHLSRHGHSKNMLKLNRADHHAPKRGLAANKAREESPEAHPTVHFDVGDEDEGPDDGWTEASASQSPATTRSNTRSNSVVIEPHKVVESSADQSTEEETSHAETSRPTAQTLPDRTRAPKQSNGDDANHRSRAPDADIITSRLLRRTSSHHPPPQMSSVAATVVSNSQDARVLSQSTSQSVSASQSGGSTLVDTPGRDLVSRFMDAGSSGGTPKIGSRFLPSRGSPQSATGDFDEAKRNKSMPNFGDTGTPARTPSRRSGTSTPTDLPPSRTQQKLMLQRASSNIEPQKLIPAILPRTGAPNGFVAPGMTFSSGEGRLDPRLQQQFNHVAVEYKVVRRFRNPVADAVHRIQQMPGIAQKSRAPTPRSAHRRGTGSVHGSSSLSTSLNEETVDSPTRRSRVSFENMDGHQDEGDLEGRQSFGSENERMRNEAEEICRRMWESTELVGGE